MLGWQIIVYRELSRPYSPGPWRDKEARVATWLVGLGGLDWLDELVKEGKAEYLSCGGYPDIFLAKAKDILPKISPSPPHHFGEVIIYHPMLAQCLPEEQLIIEAWDQS